jgi:alkanesulfonate monooxygenase SsuD/methylene tetrahydromethanopterin reductase-like flavin-dependent oxidoreductase (luciferase family)
MPPVWIAGAGPKVLRLAARRAQWTNFAKGISVEDFRGKAAAVQEAARAEGQPPPGLSLTATFMVGEPHELDERLGRRAAARGIDRAAYERRLRAANVFVGDPAELARQMGEYVAVGCSSFVLWPLDGEHERVAAPLGAAASLLRAE